VKKRAIELLAPGGDVDSIKAAILAGADAVYCGLGKFNARNRASNISFDDLQGILRVAHQNNCEVFLTLNIIIVEAEIPSLWGILNKLVNTSIDGIIVQDLGMFYLLSKYFKGLNIHASTQVTTHNEGQVLFFQKLKATRVNLSRELNIQEVKALATVCHLHDMLAEVFVHGSYCISFSGICYMSSVHGGNSGNRGRCSQPCRDRYLTTPAGKNYPLNLKDNSAWFDLRDLTEAGVDSLKIEGRIKKSDYVYTVVVNWRKQIQSFYHTSQLIHDNGPLYKVFNRDFSNGFLKGDISKDMFIDHPRDHSINHLSELDNGTSKMSLEYSEIELYDQKEAIKTTVEQKIKQFSVAKAPVFIAISGKSGSPLTVSVKTPDFEFVVNSEINLENKGTEALNYEMVYKRLKSINETEYYLAQIEIENSGSEVYLPFKELTSIKKKVLYRLNGSGTFVEPVKLPILKKVKTVKITPALTVLISSKNDLRLIGKTKSSFCFHLPERLNFEVGELIDLFLQHKKLIPWFPSIQIGADYTAAVEFLELVHPELIVTNNTGIAFAAYRMGINWIAGPYLNVTNSYSLICLKGNFNCTGSFISNEISKIQIAGITRPEDFKLFYTVFNPALLMTSRQCLSNQVSGCIKNNIDDSCITCEKSSSITNMKESTFLIQKTKGNYHHVYNETSFLNTGIVSDFPDLFAGFLIDLRDVTTATTIATDKLSVIHCFENLLNGYPDSVEDLRPIFGQTTDSPYTKGI
jgi:putative protease